MDRCDSLHVRVYDVIFANLGHNLSIVNPLPTTWRKQKKSRCVCAALRNIAKPILAGIKSICKQYLQGGGGCKTERNNAERMEHSFQHKLKHTRTRTKVCVKFPLLFCKM